MSDIYPRPTTAHGSRRAQLLLPERSNTASRIRYAAPREKKNRADSLPCAYLLPRGA